MPRFKKYVSKEFLISGSEVPLKDAKLAWEKLDKRMRTAIRKAQSHAPTIVEVSGDEHHIRRFYEFCPNREDLPELIDPARQKMYFAYIEDRLVGCTIVVETGGNLFLHFNAVTEEGREKQISPLLVWHVIETFAGGPYRAFDVGASYKPTLQKFFSGFGVDRYPVLMRPPEYKPQLTVTPFENSSLGVLPDPAIDVPRYLDQKFAGREFTYFPRGMYAIYALFKWLVLEGRLSAEDEVAIITNSGSPYISSCVTSALEESCRWNQEIRPGTKAIFVIHEFGHFNEKIRELREYATEHNIVLIEDCAYAWHLPDAGTFGDYVIYSCPKWYPVQFGGFLVGKHFEYQYMWDTFACADAGKEERTLRDLSAYVTHDAEIAMRRRENYGYYVSVFGAERAFFTLKDGDAPGAFVLKVESEERMRTISEFVRSFGIECGNYYHNSAIFLPVHQNLSRGHLEYICGAVRAMYREGSGLDHPYR